MRRRVPVPACVLALLLVLASCDGGDGSPAQRTDPGDRPAPEDLTGPPEQATITIGTLPTVGVAPLEYALGEGLFDEEGLTVETELAVTGVTESLIGGEYDFVYSSYIVPFHAREQGLSVAVAAGADQAGAEAGGIVVMPDSDIREPEDLVGKRVGAPTVAIGQVLLYPALEELGIDSEEVQVIEVFFPSMLPTLQQGDVDAIIAPEPLWTEGHETLDVRDLDIAFFPEERQDEPIAGYITTESFAAENPRTVAAFQRVIEQAAGFLNENPEVVADLLPEYMGLAPDLARKVTPSVFTEQLDVDDLQGLADVMTELGLLPGELDVSDFVLPGA